MAALELILLLVAVAAVLQTVARRFSIPLPAILVTGGLLLAVIPGVPRVSIPPDLVFLIFVPPLLFSGAIQSSWREFQTRARPILSLAVGLVIATMIAVAVVVHALNPAFGWASAFVLESLIFIFIGLELPVVAAALGGYPIATLVQEIAIVSAVCIAVRLLWVFPSAAFTRAGEIRGGKRVWREVAFIGWTGMRGADSLVITLALPTVTQQGTPFPARAFIIVITFGVLLSTLVLQGLTLKPVVRLLGLANGSRALDDQEEAFGWKNTSEAALTRLADIERRIDGQAPEVRAAVARLRAQYEARRRKFGSQRPAVDSPVDETNAERHLKRAVIDAERQRLLELRDTGAIDDTVVRHLARYMDLETLLANYPGLGTTESPFEVIPPDA